MRYLSILLFFICSFAYGQGIEPTSLQPTPYQGGVLKGMIPFVDEFTGDTLYIYQHDVLANDSIYTRNDSIFLKNGSGFAVVTDSIYRISGASKDTLKLRDGSGYVLVDKGSYNRVRGSGVPTRIAYWLGTDSLGHSAKLYWDSTNVELDLVGRLNIGANGYPTSIYIGKNTGVASTGAYNVVVGYEALNNNTTGYANVSNGYQSLYSNTTGVHNVSNGYQSLRSNTTGSYNVSSGYQSLYSNTTGEANVSSGHQSLYSNTTGTYNVSNGLQSLYSNVSGSYNVSNGLQSLYSNVSGSYNVSNGLQSLYSNTTGTYNVSNGYQSLYSNTTGVHNVSNGYQSLRSNTTGSYNISNGYQSLFSNTTGTYNVSNGYQSLYSNVSGSYNVSNGLQSLYSNTTGSYNISNGLQSLYSNVSGSYNISNGLQSLYSNVSGSYNISNGLQSLYSNTTGHDNISNGYQSLRSNTTGSYNISNGYQSLFSNTTGNYNVSSGHQSLFSNTTGNYNVSSGYQSLYSNTTGEANVSSGHQSLYSNTTGTYNVSNGLQSLYSNVSGSYNISNGLQSLYSNVSGSYNISNGLQSLYSNTTGHDNISNGYQSLRSNTTGSYNISNGYQSLYSNNEGSQSVAIGRESFYSNVSGWSNVGLGAYSGYHETGSNKLYIENSTSTQPLIGGDFVGDKVGINNVILDIARTLDVNGEVRIRDLATDLPTMIVGADDDGDLNGITVGNGLTLSSSNITANIDGTLNRVAKFTSQYSVGNSQIYTVGDSLVGINQNTPQYHLDVTGKFRVTNRDGMPVTGAGFTSNGQLVAYNLDTALATPNTYLSSGMYIDIDGTGTMADPYEINNTKPENTTVKDGLHLDFEELANDTITASIIPGSIGATELESTSVVAGTYNYATITVDGDGRITSASNNTDQQGITSIATASPITGGPITSSGTIGINNAAADGSTKGASTYTASDFNDNGSGLISIDYTNGQAASGSTKGFLTSSDWNTFNSKEPAISLGTADQYWRGDKTWQNFNTSARNAISLTTTGSSGASTYNSSTGVLNVPNYTLSGLGGMDKWGYVAPSGSGGNVIAYVLDDQVINYYNGNGITIGRASGTHDVTITNTKPFDFLGVQANSGATGTLSNFGTLNLIGAGGTTVSRSGSNFTISSSSGSGTVTNVSATAGNGISTSVTNPTTTPNITVTNTKPFDYIGLQANSGSIYSLPNTWVLNLTGAGGTTVTRSNNSFTISSASTDNQTLSWSSPNLSISGGNSVTLPVLPSGSVNNTLRHDGSGWSATSLLSTTTSRVDVNSWPSTVNLGSKLLVNGGIQYNQSGFAATEISGRDAQGGLTGVSVGSGLTLSSGTLSATPIYAEVSYIGPSSTIGSWTSISFNQTAISNGMSTSSSGITIPSNGNYKIEYSVWGTFGNNTLTGYSGMQTRVFSGGVKGTRTERVYHSNTQPMDLSISHSCIFASLTAGQLVNLDVQQFSNSGAALTISAANLIVTKL